METRKKKITKVDATRIDKAIADLKALYARTKQYESTKVYLENCIDRLGVLRVFYLAHLGLMEKSIRFPYNSREWKHTFSDAKMIYTYARKPRDKKDTAPAHWEIPVKVFELAIERVEWLEARE
jgi:hypothetical protein